MTNKAVKPSKRLKAPWPWSALLGVLALLVVAQPAEAALTPLSTDEFTTEVGPNWLRSDGDGDIYASGGKLKIETTGAGQVAGVSSYGFAAELTSTEGVQVQGFWARSASGSTTGNADSEIIVRNYYDESQWVAVRYVASANRFELRTSGGNYAIGGSGTTSEQFFQIIIKSSTFLGTIGSGSATISHSMAGTQVFQVVLRDSMHASGTHISTRDGIAIAARLPADTTPPEYYGPGVYGDHPWSKLIPTVMYASWLDHSSGVKSGTYTIGTTNGASNVQPTTPMPPPPSTGYRFLYTPSWQPPQLAQGLNYVNTQVSDVANNVVTANGVYLLRYDTLGPLASGSPAIIDWTNTIPTLTGKTWTDPHSGLAANAEYSVGLTSGGFDVVPWTALTSQPSTGQTTGYGPSITPAALWHGTNFVNVRVSDVLGTMTTTNSAYTIRYDGALPNGPTVPTVEPWSNVNPALQGACFNDGVSGLKPGTATYKLGTAPNQGDLLATTAMTEQPTDGQTDWCPLPWTIDTIHQRQGLNYVTMSVQDRAGNTYTGHTHTIRRDTVNDQVSNLRPAASAGGSTLPSSWQTDNTPCFEWSPAASTSPLLGYSYAVSTTNVNPDTTPDTTGTSVCLTLADGTSYFKVRPVDAAGNGGIVSGTMLRVDTVVPGVPTITSSSHPDKAKWYSTDDVASSWSATDATSGVTGYSWDFTPGIQTGSPDTIPDAGTSHNPQNLGSFGTWTLRVRAGDAANNWGPTAIHYFRVDKIQPTFEVGSVRPLDGSTSFDATPGIGVGFNERDNSADLMEQTRIDVASLVFNVDDVSVLPWKNVCGPTGPLALCRFEADTNHVYYEPLLDMADGAHTSLVTASDTVVNANKDTMAWDFEVRNIDVDRDNIPDDIEVMVCEHEIPDIDADGSCVGGDWTAPNGDELPHDVAYVQETVNDARDDADADGDSVPDSVEPTLCSEEDPELASDGSCTGNDWTIPGAGAPSQDVASMLELLEAIRDQQDPDGDGIPNALEPTLCAAENNTLKSDGSCNEAGTDWTLPATSAPGQDAVYLQQLVSDYRQQLDSDGDGLPNALESALCSVEDGNLQSEGTCNAANTDWTPPGAGAPGQDAGTLAGAVEEARRQADPDGDGIPNALEATLCSVEFADVQSDGSCNTANTDWTPPGAGAPGNDVAELSAEIEALRQQVDPDGDGIPNALEAVLCDVELPDVASDGSCDQAGVDYSTPSLASVFQDVDAVVELAENALSQGDQDEDNIPDALESEFCDRNVTRNAILATSALGHSCASRVDYQAPPSGKEVFLPLALVPGPDADGDGLPATVTVQGMTLSVDPFRNPVLVLTPGEPQVVEIDAKDDDANDPVLSSVTFSIPVNVQVGADADQDAVPASVTVVYVNVTVDRNAGANAITTSQGGSVTQGVDPNDANNAEPAPSQLTVPVTIPSGLAPGPDADHDDVPDYVKVYYMRVVIDRRPNANPVGTVGAGSTTQDLDGNDSDPNVPLADPPVTLSIPVDADTGADEDGDLVPATFVVSYIDVTIDRTANPRYAVGTHNELVDNPAEPDDHDADVPVSSQPTVANVPVTVVAHQDNDDDYVPGQVTTTYLRVEVDRRDAVPVTAGFTTETSSFPSENDNARNDLVPWSAFDGDGDQLPDSLEFVFCEVEKGGDPDDGGCTGSNYTAPADTPNPWRI